MIEINNAEQRQVRIKRPVGIGIEEPLTLHAQQNSELILIHVPSCKGWGYSADALKGQKK